MTDRPSLQYPAAELVTRTAVDRALKYFQGIRTPSNSAEIQRKVNAMIDVGGLMLFRHRESLLLAALNYEQRAVLAEHQAVTSTQRVANDAPSLHEADSDPDSVDSPAFH